MGIQPMFHYFIQSYNDPVMEKFTNRIIPETTLQGSSNGLRMIGAAQEGDGNMVWETMHQNTEAWNPRSSWSHIKDRSQAEKIAFKKYIPTILAVDKTISKRLKDISLVITTLSTSLHDTMIEGMNKGFKTASGSLKDLKDDHRDLLEALGTIFDVLENDMPADMKIVAVSIILAFIILQSGIGFWQNRTIQLQNGSVETIIRDMSERMENMEQTMKETVAKMEKQIEDMIQERRPAENDFETAITQAVEQTVNRAITDARPQRLQDRRDPTADQIQSGSRYMGNSVSTHPGPHAIALIGTRR